jgi:hypothetical protein
MKRVGVAKLPLSTPAPSASVAAPEDAIKKAVSVIVSYGSGGESFIYAAPAPLSIEPKIQGAVLIMLNHVDGKTSLVLGLFVERKSGSVIVSVASAL